MRLALIIASAAAAALLLAWLVPGEEGAPDGPTGPPWETQRVEGGGARTFGLVPGRSTLEQALARFGARVEAAVFDSPGRPLAAEAYWSSVHPGGLKGRLILELALPEQVLRELVERSPGARRLESGSVRYDVNPADAPVLERAVIASMSYVPSVDLEPQVLRRRFGEPAERVPAENGEHWLYPQRGLAITLRESGREIMSYVNPADMERLRSGLLERGTE